MKAKRLSRALRVARKYAYGGGVDEEVMSPEDEVQLAGPIVSLGRRLIKGPRNTKLVDPSERLSGGEYGKTLSEVGDLAKELKDMYSAKSDWNDRWAPLRGSVRKELNKKKSELTSPGAKIEEPPAVVPERRQGRLLGREDATPFQRALEKFKPVTREEEDTLLSEFSSALERRSAPEVANKWVGSERAESEALPRSPVSPADPNAGTIQYEMEQAFRMFAEENPDSKIAKEVFPRDRINMRDMHKVERAREKKPEWKDILNPEDEVLYPGRGGFDPDLDYKVSKDYILDPAQRRQKAIEGADLTEPFYGLHVPQRTERQSLGSKDLDAVQSRPIDDEWDVSPQQMYNQLNQARRDESARKTAMIKEMKAAHPELAAQISKNPEIAQILKEMESLEKQQEFKAKAAGKAPAKEVAKAKTKEPALTKEKLSAEPVRLWYGKGNKGDPSAGTMFTTSKKVAEKYAGANKELYYVDVPGDHALVRDIAKGKNANKKITKDLLDRVQKFASGGVVKSLTKAIGPARKYASGGPLKNIDGLGDPSKHMKIDGGLINSAIPGRTDKIPVAVKPGSYIIPADVVSSTKLGEGNTLAGGKTLDNMFRPHRIRMKKPKFIGRKARLKETKVKFPSMTPGMATGGEVDRIPIIVAGGEYHVEPEVVESVGDGNMDKGHNALDSFVKKLRKHNIKTVKGLAGPKRN